MRTAGVGGGSRNLGWRRLLADVALDALNGRGGAALRFDRAQRQAGAGEQQSQADRGERTAPERTPVHHLAPAPTETPTLAFAGTVGAAGAETPPAGEESAAMPERIVSVKRIAGRSVRSVVTSPFSQAITSSLSVLPSGNGEGVARRNFELVALQVREDPVAVAAELQARSAPYGRLEGSSR